MNEEFRGFSDLPLQRLTTSKDVADNPNFFQFVSNIAPSSNDNTGTGEEEDCTKREYEIKEQDRWLPLANVGRVMKSALPPHAKLSRESKMCIQECVSEFISFMTSGAVDKCYAENRKTLNGEDILYALHTLGFENYAEALKIYLAKYREHESLDSDERRIKDRHKRQQRKERKDREFRELQEQLSSERGANNEERTEDLDDPYGDGNDYSDTYKDEYVDGSNDGIGSSYTVAPNQIQYEDFNEVLN